MNTINLEGITKNVLYEPLMDYIIKKDYNYIWQHKQIQNITNAIVTKAVGKFRSIDSNFTREDLYTDCYMCLVKAVDTYKPFSTKGFMPFIIYYYSKTKYLADKPKCVSSLFYGKREIVTKDAKENTNIRADREVYFESDNDINELKVSEKDLFEKIYDEELIDAINTLPYNIKTIILMLMENKKQSDIAKVFGMSQPRICFNINWLKKVLAAEDTEEVLKNMPKNKLFKNEDIKQAVDLLNKFGIRNNIANKEDYKEEKIIKTKYSYNQPVNMYKITKSGAKFIGTAKNVKEAADITKTNKYSIIKVLNGDLRSSNRHLFKYAELDYYAPVENIKEEKEEELIEVDYNMDKLNIQEQINKLEEEKAVIQKKIDGLTNLKRLQEQIEELQEQLQEQITKLNNID